MPNVSPYGGIAPAPYSMACVERRVNALAVGWFVYAGIVGVFGLMALAFAHAWMGGQMGGWGGHGFGHNFMYGPGMPFFFMKFARGILLFRVVVALIAGYGLLQKTSWGRWVAIVAGCLAIFHPILGTALGIWTLVVLLNAPNAAGYEAMAR